jgi:lipoprotein NlpI
MLVRLPTFAALVCLSLAPLARAEEPKTDDADSLARQAAQLAAQGKSADAIAALDKVIALAPDRAEAYDLRGSERFKLGKIAGSIEDFDRYLKLRPDQEPWHWKRGISYYYAGRYDEGRRQFEGYQTVDDNDVENAVWRYLCMARQQGVPKARDEILKIKRDLRVPMMEVYSLYAGKADPESVLIVARGGSPSEAELNSRLFYAHLYLGLYYEAAGDAEKARHHITIAADKHKIGHYMWNVADVHAKRLRAAASK